MGLPGPSITITIGEPSKLDDLPAPEPEKVPVTEPEPEKVPEKV